MTTAQHSTDGIERGTTVAQSDAIGGALSIALGVSLLFWLIPVWVEPDADLRLPVSLVPRIVAIGFLVCGVALLARACVVRRRVSAQLDSGFHTGELRGLVVMIVIMFSATFAFQKFHFMVVAPLLVASSMWVFGPIRPLSLLLTSTFGPALVWLLTTQVLGRALP